MRKEPVMWKKQTNKLMNKVNTIFRKKCSTTSEKVCSTMRGRVTTAPFLHMGRREVERVTPWLELKQIKVILTKNNYLSFFCYFERITASLEKRANIKHR